MRGVNETGEGVCLCTIGQSVATADHPPLPPGRRSSRFSARARGFFLLAFPRFLSANPPRPPRRDAAGLGSESAWRAASFFKGASPPAGAYVITRERERERERERVGGQGIKGDTRSVYLFAKIPLASDEILTRLFSRSTERYLSRNDRFPFEKPQGT